MMGYVLLLNLGLKPRQKVPVVKVPALLNDGIPTLDEEKKHETL